MASLKYTSEMRFLLIGLAAAILFILSPGLPAKDLSQVPRETYHRSIPNNAFHVGEQLTFSIDYGPINAGTTVMSVDSIVAVGDHSCYRISVLTRSNNAFSLIYKVEDRVESFLDTEGLYSWRSTKKLREGKYKADRIYELNHRIGKAISTTKNDTIDILPFTQDALSAFYFVRTQPLNVGESFQLPQFDNGKMYNFEVKVLKKEKIKVKAGLFNTILLEPMLSTEGLFRHKGRIRVWVTDDERRIPVKMSSSIIIGSVEATLIKIEDVSLANAQ